MQTCLNSLADSLEDNVIQCHGLKVKKKKKKKSQNVHLMWSCKR